MIAHFKQLQNFWHLDLSDVDFWSVRQEDRLARGTSSVGGGLGVVGSGLSLISVSGNLLFNGPKSHRSENGGNGSDYGQQPVRPKSKGRMDYCQPLPCGGVRV